MKEKAKKKNKKRLVVLLVLFILVALAVGLVILITELSKKKDSATVEDHSIELFRMDAEKMERIEWIYKGEEYAIYREGGVWKLSSDPALELYQSACNAMANSLEVVNAEKMIESDEMEAMGFNNPSTVVKLIADGKEYVFRFGSETATGSNYYMEFDGKVSVVRSYEKNVFDKSILSLTGKEEPIETSLTKVEEEELSSEGLTESEAGADPKPENTEALPEETEELSEGDLGETIPETGVPEIEEESGEEEYTGIPEEEATPEPEKEDDIRI